MPYQNLAQLIFQNWAENQQAQKRESADLMQRQLFQKQQDDENFQHQQQIRATPTPYETYQMNQQTQNHNDVLKQQSLINEEHAADNVAKGIWKQVDVNGRDLDSSAPAAPTAPASPGFDFKTMGQAVPAPQANATQLGPTPPLSQPPASPIFTALMGGPSNGALTPTGASASNGQTGALGQASVGSVNPSQTASGQTGHDSGPLGSAPLGALNGNSVGGAPVQAPSFKPIQVNDKYYRPTTPNEQRDAKMSQAREEATEARQLASENVEATINDPKNAMYFQNNPNAATQMRMHAQSGFVPPTETSSQKIADMTGQLQQALARGDTQAAQQYQQAIHATKAAAGEHDPMGGFSPGALDQNATLYAMTGNMPRMSYGAAGNDSRLAIANRASELYPKANIAANQTEYKANSKSYVNAVNSYDTLRTYEDMAEKNMDLTIQQMQHLVDSGNPLINKPLRELYKAAGDPIVSGFNAAQQVASNEVARLTSNPNSAVLTDTARKDISSLNPDTVTAKQALHTLNVFRQDINNRRTSQEARIAAISDRLGVPQDQFLNQMRQSTGTPGLLRENSAGQRIPNTNETNTQQTQQTQQTKKKILDAATAAKYLRDNGNDRAKAEAAAVRDGY